MSESAYVIVDETTGEYFARRHSPSGGWYSTSRTDARVYKTQKAALQVINRGDHHVSYPGNRQLTVRSLSFT